MGIKTIQPHFARGNKPLSAQKGNASLKLHPFRPLWKYLSHFRDSICNHWYNGHFPRRRQLHKE